MRRLALLALAVAPASVHAQPPAPVCVRQAIVPGFEQWGRGVASPALALDRPASLRLAPVQSVAFAPPLARAPVAGTFGGNVPLHVEKPGPYRIALSAGAWIDVIGGGRRIESSAHAHGPACSGIAKIVTFTLTPGDYVVQLSEAKADGILAMVVADRG